MFWPVANLSAPNVFFPLDAQRKAQRKATTEAQCRSRHRPRALQGRNGIRPSHRIRAVARNPRRPGPRRGHPDGFQLPRPLQSVRAPTTRRRRRPGVRAIPPARRGARTGPMVLQDPQADVPLAGETPRGPTRAPRSPLISPRWTCKGWEGSPQRGVSCSRRRPRSCTTRPWFPSSLI